MVTLPGQHFRLPRRQKKNARWKGAFFSGCAGWGNGFYFFCDWFLFMNMSPLVGLFRCMVISGMALCHFFLPEFFKQLPVTLHNTSAGPSFLVAEDIA